ncbi:CBS domain-containing protein [Microvirga terricola]|uniref:CBS domain-containing protein n=1 Tax=Microvirga terricola TaxID=2719797 RepID=A0ABX0V8L7_9HYPH|nr:CBS domain-containing protein [Microvirga terricola]NIX75045.1 CBS domain-containing protein [Microvirga terricola]
MHAADLMTREIVSVTPETSLASAAEIMLEKRISGLPVITISGDLSGILTEGDLLRRSELGTERKRPRWLELVLSPGRLAHEYVQAHGRKVADVMTQSVTTVGEKAPLEEIVTLMNERNIKRIPVVRDGTVVGIVSRADILRALAATLQQSPLPIDAVDSEIREAILRELKTQSWAPIALLNVSVSGGVVDLWGTLLDERERPAVHVAVENIPGVKAVRDHLVFVEPYSGFIAYRPDLSCEGSDSTPAGQS